MGKLYYKYFGSNWYINIKIDGVFRCSFCRFTSHHPVTFKSHLKRSHFDRMELGVVLNDSFEWEKSDSELSHGNPVPESIADSDDVNDEIPFLFSEGDVIRSETMSSLNVAYNTLYGYYICENKK